VSQPADTRRTSRRTLVATVGAIVLTMLAGGAAMAANLGILGTAGSSSVGRLSSVTDTKLLAPTTTARPRVQTVYVDQYVHDTVPPAPAASRSTWRPAPSVPAPAPAGTIAPPAPAAAAPAIATVPTAPTAASPTTEDPAAAPAATAPAVEPGDD
jgi:hypothetical protein